MLSKKIISAILSICIVGGGGTVAAVTLANTPSHPANLVSEVSSSISSSTSADSTSASIATSSQITSSKEANSVDDSVSKINDATSQGVKKINDAASKAVDKVQQAASSSSTSSTQSFKKAICYYSIVNPDTGKSVSASDPNYEKFKAQIGGDAGTVTASDSVAIKALSEKMQATWDAKEKEARTVK